MNHMLVIWAWILLSVRYIQATVILKQFKHCADGSALIIGSGFNNEVGIWHIEGFVEAVPVPAAIWLLVIGFGFSGVIWYSKTKNVTFIFLLAK